MAPWSHADTKVDRELTRQVDEILKEWSKLKPGTTRVELLKVFTPDGGFSGIWEERFIYRHFPDIKVDVKFKPTEPNQKGELPTDTIQIISKPYLELPYSD